MGQVRFGVDIEGCDCSRLTPCNLPATVVSLQKVGDIPSICEGASQADPDQMSEIARLNATWETALRNEKDNCDTSVENDPVCSRRLDAKQTDCENKKNEEIKSCDKRMRKTRDSCEKEKEFIEKDAEEACNDRIENAETCGKWKSFY